MSTINLSTVEARAKIKPQREPYYVKVKTGCYIGFRKMTANSEGTWVARCRSSATGQQLKSSLGDFAHLPPSKRYDAALEEASKWFTHVGMGGTNEVKTVKDACAAYVTHIREGAGDKDALEVKAKDAEARFARWVDSDPIGSVQLAKLTRHMLEKWRKTLANTPVTINPHAEPEDQRRRPRSPATLNRDMAALRAALNHARAAGYVASDTAWLGPLRPIPGADKARDVYLTRDERRELLGKAPHDLRAMLEALCLLPLRPGAMAALTVGNFDKQHGVLTIGKDKAGRDRKIKLPPSTVEVFKRSCENKLPTAPMFTRADGKAWDKDSWKKPFKAAAAAAGLTEKATTYSLRHSTITDLVSSLDLLTVAQISGTSMAMIEKHYGHLQQNRAADALAGLAL